MKLSEITDLGIRLRQIGVGAGSMEEAAQRLVTLLYDEFESSEGRNCVLVRFYLTVDYRDLDETLRAFGANLMHDHVLLPSTHCLTLLASRGEKPEWNSRKTSQGHQSIPLPSTRVVEAIPMVAQLIKQMGIDAGTVVKPDPALVLEAEQHTYNVFFVPEAVASPYIPAQSEFVIPHHVRSVLGYGGLLPNGHVYAVLMFTRVTVTRPTADMFRNIAMNLKLALLPFVGKSIFSAAS